MDSSLFQDLPVVGLMGFLFYVIIKWMINTQSKQLDAITRALKANTLAQMETYKLLLIHDATIRGVNPTAGETMTEAHAIAHAEYQRILASVEATQEAIKNTL